MTITEIFSGIPVADFEAAAVWYERFAGRPADLVPSATEVAWQLEGSSWIYVVTDPERAGNALLTLLVDDLDAFLAELAARGVVTGPVDEVVPGVRRTVIADPEGNQIALGEAAA
jgi:predicted enzyme related to lactoylglutathione lyase